MKIIISANTSWYLFNFRLNTIRSLLEKGVIVGVLAPRDQYSERLEKLGCEYFELDMEGSGTNIASEGLVLGRIYRVLKRFKPEYLLNFTPKNNIYGTFAARFTQTKVINNISGLGSTISSQNLFSKFMLFLYRQSQKHADKIFFQNLEDMQLFEENSIAPDVPKERIPGSGVDLERFIFQPLNADRSKVRFLLAARLIKEKGVELYFESAKYLREVYGDKVEFHIVGFLDEKSPNGISKEVIEGWEAQQTIIYHGPTNKVEIFMREADCIVLPSFYGEGVPKSLLEAAALGRPIITTDNIGCRETVIEGENGYICQPRSFESLTEAIEKYLALSFSERQLMGQQSRKLVEEKFDENFVIQRYLLQLGLT